MSDVIEAMEAIQLERGGKVTLDCELHREGKGRARVLWTATLVSQPSGYANPTSFTAQQGWPTNTHRSVLALLWSLLHDVDNQFEAAEHVASLSRA